MKKIMMILAALVLLLSAAYAEENDLLARIRQKGEIVVATEGAWGAVDVSRRERPAGRL